MALFGNESDKIKHSEDQAKPQPSVTPPSSGVTVASEASARATTYLDRATKVTGQLNFEGPARSTGTLKAKSRAFRSPLAMVQW